MAFFFHGTAKWSGWPNSRSSHTSNWTKKLRPLVRNMLAVNYIRCMSRMRATAPTPRRKVFDRVPAELLVPKRTARGRKSDVVELQWYDGAGELQYEELSPAQSWPYLSKN